MDILNKVKNDRETEKQLGWEGTFAEYLDLVKKTPQLHKLLIPVSII